jgi:RimJ/RimL family protein N-acetyltransferase
VIRGELVSLRPLTAADLERAERVANDPEYNGPFGTFALTADGDVRRRFELDGYLNHDHGRLIVVDASGATVGVVSYIAIFHGPPPSNRVYNIGIDIDPAHRRRGYGAAAQALLARYLFDTYTIERVEASTDGENVAEQRARERARVPPEGRLRHAQWRAGAWRDVCLYSKLRGE